MTSKSPILFLLISGLFYNLQAQSVNISQDDLTQNASLSVDIANFENHITPLMWHPEAKDSRHQTEKIPDQTIQERQWATDNEADIRQNKIAVEVPPREDILEESDSILVPEKTAKITISKTKNPTLPYIFTEILFDKTTFNPNDDRTWTMTSQLKLAADHLVIKFNQDLSQEQLETFIEQLERNIQESSASPIYQNKKLVLHLTEVDSSNYLYHLEFGKNVQSGLFQMKDLFEIMSDIHKQIMTPYFEEVVERCYPDLLLDPCSHSPPLPEILGFSNDHLSLKKNEHLFSDLNSKEISKYNIPETEIVFEKWSTLTPSQKISEISQKWNEAQELEKKILTLEKEAISAPLSERIKLWNFVIQQAKNLKKIWKEMRQCYDRDKSYPPYWLQSYWMDEFEKVKEREAWWYARPFYYSAEKNETKAYLAQEETFAGKKSWDKTIEIAKAALFSWHDAVTVLVLDPGYEKNNYLVNGLKIEESKNFSEFSKVIQQQSHIDKQPINAINEYEINEVFKKQWTDELQKMNRRRDSWYSTFKWYIEQGKKGDNPEIKGILARHRVEHTEPSPNDGLSKYESENYPNAELIDYRKFKSPENQEEIEVRIRVLKIENGDPIRIEEIIAPDTQNVIKRVEMAANHFLIVLNQEENEKSFCEKLKSQKYDGVFSKLEQSTTLKRDTGTVNVYRFYFLPTQPNKLEEAWEKAFTIAQKLQVEPEPNFFFVKHP